NQQKYYHWVKIPDVDDDGRSRHKVPLEYQRMLALTENAVNTETRVLDADRIKRRRQASSGAVLVGIEQPALIIPYYPLTVLSENQQWSPPTTQSGRLLRAYARRVARTRPPDNPNLHFHSVKIYKLAHAIPTPAFAYIFERAEIRDPDSYRAHFMGEYDA